MKNIKWCNTFFSLACFSVLRSINILSVSLGWLLEIIATQFGFIIPLFCHAISSKVFPNTEVWSNPRDVIPTIGVFLNLKTLLFFSIRMKIYNNKNSRFLSHKTLVLNII